MKKTTAPGSRGSILLTTLALVAALLWAGMAFEQPVPASELVIPRQARSTAAFLDTIGVVSSFPDRGQPLDKTAEMLRYGGFRWVRAGIEGLSENGPTTVQTFIDLHKLTGAKVSWGLVSGGTDIARLVRTGRELAKAGALLAFEGNNEPNNWGVTYQGEKGGRGASSWMAVAKLQRDLYRAVKSDPILSGYPVWSVSEPGAERDNVGLQFLTIPEHAETLMPAGTRYADFANVHNYVFHPHSPLPEDNKAWNASDPGKSSPVDGLYGNFGRTWRHGYPGYPDDELTTLPRVSTETGLKIADLVTERMQAVTLINLYLDQFARGYSYTSVYILRDRTDEAGNQAYGFFRPDYSPRLAAIYLHNLTTILADRGITAKPGKLVYALEDKPDTVHDTLLQRSDGTFQLVVWGERLSGIDRVRVKLGKTWASAAIFDPTVGTRPVKVLQDAKDFSITLSDHPLIIELKAPKSS